MVEGIKDRLEGLNDGCNDGSKVGHSVVYFNKIVEGLTVG
jgi:hypothetical protein